MKLLQSKLPTRYIFESLKKAWLEAFPAEIEVSKLFDERRNKIKLQKKIFETEWTPDQLSQFESKIPEWKKGAIIFIRKIQDSSVTKPKKRSIIRNYLREKYKQNPDMIELLNELEGVGGSFGIMKDNVQQKILYSNNLVVNNSMKLISKVKEKLNVDAIAEMRIRDPEFEFDVFEKEIRFIFEEMYHEFLCHNLKYLERICVGEALVHFRQLINEHQAKFGRPKYTDILNVSFPNLETSFVTDDKVPVFCFSINFQEITCLVDPNDVDTILDGDETRMNYCDYVVYVMPHPNPDLETVGHSWLFFRITERNKAKQLI